MQSGEPQESARLDTGQGHTPPRESVWLGQSLILLYQWQWVVEDPDAQLCLRTPSHLAEAAMLEHPSVMHRRFRRGEGFSSLARLPVSKFGALREAQGAFVPSSNEGSSRSVTGLYDCNVPFWF